MCSMLCGETTSHRPGAIALPRSRIHSSVEQSSFFYHKRSLRNKSNDRLLTLDRKQPRDLSMQRMCTPCADRRAILAGLMSAWMMPKECKSERARD